MPREVIRLSAYAQLDLYLTKFARGELGLVLLLGRHGTGKSESVRQTLSAMETANAGKRPERPPVAIRQGPSHPRRPFLSPCLPEAGMR